MPLYLSFVVSCLLCGWIFENSTLRAMLATVFAIVVVGYWAFQSPFAMYEGSLKLVNVASIVQSGHVVLSLGNYLGYPAYFITGAALSIFSGMGLSFQLAFVIFNLGLMSLSFYVLTHHFLKNSLLAFLASVLVTEGNVYLATYQFHPDLLSVNLVLLSIIVLETESRRSIIPSILLFFLIIMSDFTASSVVFSFLVIRYVFSKRYLLRSSLRLVIGSYILVFLAWNIFWGEGSIPSILSDVISNLGNLLTGVNHVRSTFSSNVTGPPWSTLVNVTWITMLDILPLVILFASSILKGRKSIGGTIPSFFLASVAVGIATIIGQAGVNYFVVLLYAPFAGTLILLGNQRLLGRKLLLVGILITTLCVPTFLAFNYRVVTASIPSQDAFAGYYFAMHSSTTAVVYTDNFAIQWYNPAILIAAPPETATGAGNANLNSSDLVAAFSNGYLASFESHSGAFFEFYPTMLDNYYHQYGSNTGNNLRKDTLNQLHEGNLLYTNGYDLLFNRI